MQIKSDSLSKKQKRKKKKHDFTGNINPDNLIKKGFRNIQTGMMMQQSLNGILLLCVGISADFLFCPCQNEDDQQ